MLLINKHGVDSLRLYMMSSTVMKADNLNFSEDAVNELRKKVFGIWWNVFAFYKLYADQTVSAELPTNITHVMDQWMVSHMSRVVRDVTAFMDAYDVVNASRVLIAVVDELSTWYVRESRERLRDASSNQEMSQVFAWVLLTLAKLFAPITPFFSEVLYQHMEHAMHESIHLEDWPTVNTTYINDELEEQMIIIRKSAEEILAERKSKNIRVRQPLSFASLATTSGIPSAQLVDILRHETNVDEFKWVIDVDAKKYLINLDTNFSTSPDLIARGEMREVMRTIQDLRKNAGIAFNSLASVQLPSWPKQYEEEIKKKTLVKELVVGDEAKIIE